MSQWTRVDKTVNRVETHWLSRTEKVLGATVSKESHANSVLGHERNHYNLYPWKGSTTIVIFEKSATANSTTYCQKK